MLPRLTNIYIKQYHHSVFKPLFHWFRIFLCMFLLCILNISHWIFTSGIQWNQDDHWGRGDEPKVRHPQPPDHGRETGTCLGGPDHQRNHRTTIYWPGKEGGRGEGCKNPLKNDYLEQKLEAGIFKFCKDGNREITSLRISRVLVVQQCF